MNVVNRQARPAPPRPKTRKENPVNLQFEEKAKGLIRDAMRARGVTLEDLTRRLSNIGVNMSKGGVANKISRGGFSAAFLLQCMDALDVDLKATTR